MNLTEGAMIRLLLPVDGSETSARAVQMVADCYPRLAPLRVWLLHVRIADSMPRSAFDERSLQIAKRALESAEAVFLHVGVPCISEVKDGYVPSVIVQHARSANCDGIVMGTRGMGSTGEVMGSIARQVIALADIPVTLVK